MGNLLGIIGNSAAVLGILICLVAGGSGILRSFYLFNFGAGTRLIHLSNSLPETSPQGLYSQGSSNPTGNITIVVSFIELINTYHLTIRVPLQFGPHPLSHIV